MDSDTEVNSICRQGNMEEERKRWKRPPSSYGSMKSEESEEEEERNEEEVAMLPDSSAPEATRLQLIRSNSPETLYTMITQQLPPGADVIDTRLSDPGSPPENDEDAMDNVLRTNSPEPPEPIEFDSPLETEENRRLGRLHPEQDLPYIFKSIQSCLTSLTWQELLNFKLRFIQCEQGLTEQQVTEGDLLDFVDKILEILGLDHALMHTISNLETIGKKTEADDLRNQCKRAFIRFHLKQQLIRKHQIIREGVVRAGRWNPLDTIYVEPQISTRCHGGVDPSHEFRSHPASPLQVPSTDTFVRANELFRLQTDDGKPVRTVLTTGIPGIGMSVSVGKFSLDWAEQRANKDLQFVIKLSFHTFWLLRNNLTPSSQKMSIMEVIEYCHPECKDMAFLEEDDCRFLVIMDSFDCYQARLDWENAPVINDNYTQAHPDVLIVNIIRGTLLHGACIWILGRRGAVSQIPSELIDVGTEIQGFSDEMKDDYLTRRFSDAELAAKIVSHHKRLLTLSILARQPFVCWMVATVFERCFRYQGYGVHPPRLTPFYVNILIVQTNRRLQFYYGKHENELKWSSEDKDLLTNMGHMAFKMMERKTSVFFEEDVKQCGLELTEVTVSSGLCTELPSAESDGRRTFCFIHFTFQEFMAALYVFTMFYVESKNVLDSGSRGHFPKIIRPRSQAKSAANLVQCVLVRTFSSALGDYDMFLRFLCGLLSPHCHKSLLSGFLFPHNAPKVDGLDEVQRLLEQTIDKNPGDRVENLKECLREMIQEDE
ncbi:protein NLRC3 [Hippoglossus hippoglossus]|uniref:protein NLRC3 n=1 Tax=Hippoglossus hippoglossus TaxID=8267 RepID=UPI00148C1BB9|nr:protein NLRC3 [Hippoglossus hippoglossus]